MTIKDALEGIQLTKNFRAVEFANTQDGYAIILPDPELVKKMQALRDCVGPITTTSGTRTVKFNAKVGGSSNSYHLKGLAVDCVFEFKPYTKATLTKLLQRIGFTNVNFYWNKNKTLNRIHVDIGPTWNGEKFNYRDKYL